MIKPIIFLITTMLVFFNSAGAEKNDLQRKIIPAITPGRLVDTITMKKIYEEVKTPYKYGVIIKSNSKEDLVDCVNIFRYKTHWYMIYVESKKSIGYQTLLARSEDLLSWEKMGTVLSFTQPGKWDAWQAAASVALCDYQWGGSYNLEKYDNKYWLSYIGGALQGYETDPLSIGMAWTKKPNQAKEWVRIKANPVLSPFQNDVRSFERVTLYKSQIIHDKSNSLGWPFVMYYNGKIKNGYEKIGMAVSKDMINWIRYGQDAVIANGVEQERGISGDPQIVKIGEVWVMFYFGAFWKPGAFDTFACSYDLVNWTKWHGKHLVAPSESYDFKYAHKPWVIKWKGVVYHFYCAVGSEGRSIALATSKDLKH